jgi:hypothetical protein
VQQLVPKSPDVSTEKLLGGSRLNGWHPIDIANMVADLRRVPSERPSPSALLAEQIALTPGFCNHKRDLEKYLQQAWDKGKQAGLKKALADLSDELASQGAKLTIKESTIDLPGACTLELRTVGSDKPLTFDYCPKPTEADLVASLGRILKKGKVQSEKTLEAILEEVYKANGQVGFEAALDSLFSKANKKGAKAKIKLDEVVKNDQGVDVYKIRVTPENGGSDESFEFKHGKDVVRHSDKTTDEFLKMLKDKNFLFYDGAFKRAFQDYLANDSIGIEPFSRTLKEFTDRVLSVPHDKTSMDLHPAHELLKLIGDVANVPADRVDIMNRQFNRIATNLEKVADSVKDANDRLRAQEVLLNSFYRNGRLQLARRMLDKLRTTATKLPEDERFETLERIEKEWNKLDRPTR